LLDVTTYFAAGPATVTTLPLVPLRPPASVPVKVYVTPASVPEVNCTVAMPLAFVLDVGDANDPFAPVLLHVTVTLGLATGFPDASASCAVMVTGLPAATVAAFVVTTYFVAAGPFAVDVITGDAPLIAPVVAVTVCCAPIVLFVVNETVATPFELVMLVGLANEPPFELVHVTV